LGHVLEGFIETLDSFFLLPFYSHVLSSFPLPCPSAVLFLPCHKPKNNGASLPWNKASETVSQNKPFLLEVVFLRYFDTAMES
jgi:hypothetical protein